MQYVLGFIQHGFFPVTFWWYVLYLMVMTHITIVTVTVFYHRAQAHNALHIHPALEMFFRLNGWMTTGMIVKQWVAIHREHHARDDREGDPHSPQIYGLWRVFPFGVVYYYQKAKDARLVARRGKGTPSDWMERNVFTSHPFVGVSLMLLINFMLFGWVGIVIWLVQMVWIPFWAAGVINGIGHWPLFRRVIGYRNNDTPDASSNIIPWGILIGGEELHNNHHAFPTSAKLSLRWYEFDIGWMYIRLFEFFRLVKVLHAMPVQEEARSKIDAETIEFLRGDKGYVHAAYRKLLLRLVSKEMRDERLVSIRSVLSDLRTCLRNVRWSDTQVFERVKVRLTEIKTSGSQLPLVADFIELSADIRATSREVKTTQEREESLVVRLNQWAERMRTLSVPKVQQFVDMLVRTVNVRSRRV